MVDLFDASQMYDEDYLHLFAAPPGAPAAHPDVAHSEIETELVWRVLGLQPGMRVLDLGCGHGRIANRLAARGCHVTGLDFSEVFLDRARADASALGVSVDYLAGDMRALPWVDEFDRVVCWATAFGYFDDATNRGVLEQIRTALRPGGRLAMDLNNLMCRLRGYESSRARVSEDGDMFVDRFRLAPLTGRLEVERTIIRGGRARTVPFVVRLLGFPEVRDWLVAAGFHAVAGFGEDGAELTADHERMVVVATAS